MEFVVGAPPKAITSSDVTTTIAGRTTLIESFELGGSSALCLVETGLRAYNTSGSLVETAVVDVHVPSGTTADACTVGKAVAAVTWPKLPSGN
jgi:hypothetical protein